MLTLLAGQWLSLAQPCGHTELLHVQDPITWKNRITPILQKNPNPHIKQPPPKKNPATTTNWWSGRKIYFHRALPWTSMWWGSPLLPDALQACSRPDPRPGDGRAAGRPQVPAVHLPSQCLSSKAGMWACCYNLGCPIWTMASHKQLEQSWAKEFLRGAYGNVFGAPLTTSIYNGRNLWRHENHCLRNIWIY